MIICSHVCNFCQVVWSVATVPSNNRAFDLTAVGSLRYRTVLINLGDVWSPTHNAAIIAMPGIYYTVVTMDISCVQPTSFWLRVNEENIFEIMLSLRTTGDQTQDNGAVIRLNDGDTLTVITESLLSAHCYYISSNATASFFGILLSPDKLHLNLL
jgi:hypothetical protein